MTENTKIAIRLEGGLGDHLLANRFAHAIKEKYPKNLLHFFSDTENNLTSINLLKGLYPSIYQHCTVIGKRVNQNYKIKSIFGEETYPAHINNLPEEVLQKIKTYDKFYDLHIDGLKWLNYDFDWQRYYYFFPKPEVGIQDSKHDFPYIMCHLYARPNSPYNLEQWYVVKLLKNLSKIQKVVVVTEESYANFYQDLFDDENIIIDTPNNLIDIFSIAKGCTMFLGIDSGIRYIPYHFSKPTFLFSTYCHSYGNVTYSHLIRWLIFQKNVLPMHFDLSTVQRIVSNVISNPACALYPELIENIDKYIANRDL
jgi:hypothetical protein